MFEPFKNAETQENPELRDIVSREDGNGFFHNYVPSKEIGEKVYASLMKFYKPGKGFPLDTNYNADKYGVISNCMGLSTMLELDSMGVDVTENETELFKLIETVFESIYRGGRAVFDASPYVFNEELPDSPLLTYTETASKVAIIMLDFRRFLQEKTYQKKKLKKDAKITINNNPVTSYEDLMQPVEELLIDAVRVLTEACLPDENAALYAINGAPVERAGLDPKVGYRGWAFQCPESGDANDYESSIYFTYHATNAFVSIYDEFSVLIDMAFDKEFDSGVFQKNFDAFGDKEKKKFEEDRDFFNRNLELFRLFRNQTSSAGRYFDLLLKGKDVNLAFDFIKSDFSAVDIPTIRSSGNNHVIDTLFVLATMVNAGVDEDYKAKNRLDDYFDQIQYALTNIKKMYTALKKAGEEDFIGSYRLNFTEKCPAAYRQLMPRLRRKCANVGVYDLVPLYCNTYATVSRYLVMYPQKEMIDNLKFIMNNRAKDGWYWDREGFNANNNLYYIFALENFYEYYNDYELPLSKYGEKYNLKVSEAREESGKKEKKIEDLKAKYAELETALHDSPVESEIYKVAETMFDRKIEESICRYLAEMIEDSRKVGVELHKAIHKDTKTLLCDHPKAEMLFDISCGIDVARNIKESRSDFEIKKDVERVKDVTGIAKTFVADQLENTRR